MRGLRVDLKRIFLIRQVQIEPLAARSMIVLQTTTTLYALATTIGMLGHVEDLYIVAILNLLPIARSDGSAGKVG